MVRSAIARAWWLGVLAATGVLSAHWAAYLLAVPDDHHRGRLLESSGHSYWPYALSLILATLVVGIGGFLGDRAASGRSGRRNRSGIFSFAALRLTLLQVAGFVALEVGERVLDGDGLSAALGELSGEPAFLVGIVVQAIVALAGAVALSALAYVVDRVLGRPERPATATHPQDLTSLVPRPRPLLATGGLTLRGPPRTT